MSTEVKDKAQDKVPPAEGQPHPAAFDVLKSGDWLYELHYRKGNSKPIMIIFPYGGGHTAAIKRAQIFCTNMDYRFCGVYPHIVSLDKLEKIQEEREQY